MFALRSISASPFSGLWMSTSVSMMGTKSVAMIFFATSNCWSTTALMPTWLARCMNERILVPNTP